MEGNYRQYYGKTIIKLWSHETSKNPENSLFGNHSFIIELAFNFSKMLIDPKKITNS